MKLIEILESLSRHKEHYRVLPHNARAELAGLMGRLDQAIDEENRQAQAVIEEEKQPKKRGRPKKVVSDGVAAGTEAD